MRDRFSEKLVGGILNDINLDGAKSTVIDRNTIRHGWLMFFLGFMAGAIFLFITLEIVRFLVIEQ